MLQANLSSTKYATASKYNKMSRFSETFSFEHVFTSDGETVMTLNIPVAAEIVQLELEIKPLLSTEWTYNRMSRTLTLIGPVPSAGQTLFGIYKKIVSV